MKRQISTPNGNETSFINPPAYPFTGDILWTDLHTAVCAELRTKLTRPFLARIVGQAKTNVYSWFEGVGHGQLQAFMCLLERLSPTTRKTFIEAHCRVYPTLEHRRFFYPKGMRERVSELIAKTAGVTLITGDSFPSFALTALGHSCVLHSGSPAAGLDIHRPDKLVPVTGVLHLDETDRRQIRHLVLKAWPQLLVSRSNRLLLNGVLSRVPELQQDVFRLAKHKHVMIAEAEQIHINHLSSRSPEPVDIVTVSASGRKNEGIRVICQRQENLSKTP